MKIWYISKYANIPTEEGATRHFMLSKAIAKRGHSISMIYSRSNGFKHNSVKGLHQTSLIDQVRCVMINGTLISLGFNIRRMVTWVSFEIKLLLYSFSRKKEERPDAAIVSSLSIFTFITGIILKKVYRCKLIIEVRDIWPETIIQVGKISSSSLAAKVLRYIERAGYRHSDGIIATMPRFDLYLKEKYNMDKAFKCIPQGFDDSWIRNSANNHNIFDKDSFNVCYAGTIGIANYVDHILEAAALLEKENIKFYIIGNGPLKSSLMKTYNLPNVIFKDAVPKEEVVNLISHADLLVNPWRKHSMYKYGVSPYKWIDYMLSGVPILVSYNGFQSIINEANCGFFIDAENTELFANKIYQISKMEKSELTKMGERGRVYAMKHLNYDSLGDELLSFIEMC